MKPLYPTQAPTGCHRLLSWALCLLALCTGTPLPAQEAAGNEASITSTFTEMGEPNYDEMPTSCTLIAAETTGEQNCNWTAHFYKSMIFTGECFEMYVFGETGETEFQSYFTSDFTIDGTLTRLTFKALNNSEYPVRATLTTQDGTLLGSTTVTGSTLYTYTINVSLPATVSTYPQQQGLTLTLSHTGSNPYEYAMAGVSEITAWYTADAAPTEKETPLLRFDTDCLEYTMGEPVNTHPAQHLTYEGTGTLTYTSTDEGVVSVDANGNISQLNPGQAYVVATSAETETHLAATASLLVIVHEAPVAELADPNLHFSTDALRIDYYGEALSCTELVLNALTNEGDGTLTFTSSQPEVFGIVPTTADCLWAQQPGTATLTATSSETENYRSATAQVQIEVVDCRTYTTPLLQFGTDSLTVFYYGEPIDISAAVNRGLQYDGTEPLMLASSEMPVVEVSGMNATAMSPGETILTVSCEAGGLLTAASDTMVVRVIEYEQPTVEPIEDATFDISSIIDSLPEDNSAVNIAVDNMYVTMDTAGGDNYFDPTDGSIVLGQTMDAATMADILSAQPGDVDLTSQYNGIILRLKAGYGVLKVNAQTVGNARIALQVGSEEARLFQLDSRGYAAIDYNVNEDTYAYIYAVESPAEAEAPHHLQAREAEEVAATSEIRIYEVAVKQGETTGISGMLRDQKSQRFDLSGRRVNAAGGQRLPKGIYIVGGKKTAL